ncbi:hypothetical protein QBC39DRAFT_329118 [Podospora conica]|nr:hypothetical protein QBC39DRAFT_329118 [Schizothecium conicum]
MASTGGKTYIVEHLDEELGPWSELEYIAIATECQDVGSKFVLSSLPPAFKVPAPLSAIPAFTAETRGVEDIYSQDRSRVCLLDPAAAKDLAPEDGDNFDVFLFGGILGDDPPRDRTSELRKKGFEGRRLGPKQMTTDTAARVTRLVVEGKTPLQDVPYVDFPELKFNEHESTQMPFRYVKSEDGMPIMPKEHSAAMPPLPPPLKIHPPLINSSNPWATTLEDLWALYDCPSIGAVTTRTSLVNGFDHDPEKHVYQFFDTGSHESSATSDGTQNASLNSLGYSPINLSMYLDFIRIISDGQSRNSSKGFIVSVTGTPEQVSLSYRMIAVTQLSVKFPLAMEVNLSCPNIPNQPPPAYSKDAIVRYLEAIQACINEHERFPRIPFGLKTPPYTHSSEYEALIGALEDSASQSPDGVSPVSFITATNTLGSCLVVDLTPGSGPGGTSAPIPALPGTGIGGMAGAPLHPLALGNVSTLRRMLDERSDSLGHISIIGIGGVLDVAGYQRMRAVGAAVVGVGTGLGLKGVRIFEEIEQGLARAW